MDVLGFLARLLAKEEAEFGGAARSAAESFRRQLEAHLGTARRHERPELQTQARAALPPLPGGGDALAATRALTRWFKRDFFAWVDRPPCPVCAGPTADMAGYAAPTPDESAGAAARVELYPCARGECPGRARFPRFGHAERLLQTRAGRCGEWAMCFHLLLRAAGVEARLVYDWTDHVWVEAWIEGEGRWVHVDCCEDVLDQMRLYEEGWGKKLNYVIAVGRLGLVDVTRGYVKDWEVTKKRRTQIEETELKEIIDGLNKTVLEALSGEDVRLAKDIGLKTSEPRKMEEASRTGRKSGAKEWIEQRGEQGANSG